MNETYINQMKDWKFTKSDSVLSFGITELGFNTEYTLKTIAEMTIGRVMVLQDYALKRIA